MNWITGVNVVELIKAPPPEVFEAIVRQYPEVFHGLSLGVLVLVWVDQYALSVLYKDRVIPPPKYVLASSIALFGLSFALFLFLRSTPLYPFYLYFMVISALAIVYSLALLTGQMKEIQPPTESLFTESIQGVWGLAGLEEDDTRVSVERVRRVLRECQS
jgi:hypothetical protein